LAQVWKLVERESGRTLVERLAVADRFWSRFVGWQFRKPPAAGEGLLLVPCSSVHTCMVRFPLDLMFVDRAGEVLVVRRGVRPWRLVAPVAKSHAVIELLAGSLGEVQPGDRLAVAPANGDSGTESSASSPPKSLRFMAFQ
jgi:uncharacterized membrane protein (UPF0127 family)